jgi:hypothetical protein
MISKRQKQHLARMNGNFQGRPSVWLDSATSQPSDEVRSALTQTDENANTIRWRAGTP